MTGAEDRRTVDALAGLLLLVDKIPKRHRPAISAAACEILRLHGQLARHRRDDDR